MMRRQVRLLLGLSALLSTAACQNAAPAPDEPATTPAPPQAVVPHATDPDSAASDRPDLDTGAPDTVASDEPFTESCRSILLDTDEPPTLLAPGGEGELWLAGADGLVHRVDAATAEQRSWQLPQPSSPRALAVSPASGDAWIVASDGQAWRLPGDVPQSLDVLPGGTLTAVAIGETGTPILFGGTDAEGAPMLIRFDPSHSRPTEVNLFGRLEAPATIEQLRSFWDEGIESFHIAGREPVDAGEVTGVVGDQVYQFTRHKDGTSGHASSLGGEAPYLLSGETSPLPFAGSFRLDPEGEGMIVIGVRGNPSIRGLEDGGPFDLRERLVDDARDYALCAESRIAVGHGEGRVAVHDGGWRERRLEGADDLVALACGSAADELWAVDAKGSVFQLRIPAAAEASAVAGSQETAPLACE